MFSVILSMVIILASLGVISYLSVNDSIKRTLDNRIRFAVIVGEYINFMLETNLTRLCDISNSGSIDFDDGDWEPERKALKSAFEYSIFTDSIFLINKHGDIVLSYPHREYGKVNLMSIPQAGRMIAEGRPVISDVYTIEHNKKVIFALVPLRDRNGELIGVAGGEINPASYVFTQIIKSITVEEGTNIELVDSNGIVIASNEPRRILSCSDHDKFLGNLIAAKKNFVGMCHRCHTEENPQTDKGKAADMDKTRDMLAFAPLAAAPWGISVREPEEAVFSPAIKLKRRFIVLSAISTLTALLLALGLSRSIVRPVQSLIAATRKIGKGELSEPVEVPGKDEIGFLARSFDTMRIRLAESLDSIHTHAAELERRVGERTKDLQESREKLSYLLMKIITAQEEERKRIARELHDDTCQALNALLLSLDYLSISSAGNHPVQDKLREAREQALLILGGIQQLIKDLRPPVLDDFGLEYAIKWVLEKHLGDKGVKFHLDSTGSCEELKRATGKQYDCSKVELILFRVVQEAVINISKHAQAKNVYVTMSFEPSGIEMEIYDDGRGFVEKEVFESAGETGFGIIGMRERVALVDGKLSICSKPGEGTYVNVFVPV